MRRRSVTGGIQGNGEGGGSGDRRETTADGKAQRRRQTGKVKYHADYVGRTCLRYSYHKLLRLPQRCPCCASVFLPFPFALGRILFLLLYCFVLSVTSLGRARHLILFYTSFFYFFIFFVSVSSVLLSVITLSTLLTALECSISVS